MAARCSCVNLHFTPVSIQSAYFKAREKQEKTYENKNMAFPNPNYKEKVRFGQGVRAKPFDRLGTSTAWLSLNRKSERSDWLIEFSDGAASV